MADASTSTIEIERAVNKVIVSIHTAKPGMVIGKAGSNVDALRAQLNKLTGKQVHINIIEIKQPDLDAHLVGESIARQLEQRVAFRRAQKSYPTCNARWCKRYQNTSFWSFERC